MQFNSLQFVFFFILVVIAYYLLPRRSRWIMLLGVSYYFYMCWRPEYIVLIVFSSMIDYLAGLMLGATENPVKRKLCLTLSLTSNLVILVFFKYWHFFNENIEVLLSQFNIFYESKTFDFLLPVGISFYTFQSMSYAIDVYRKIKEPERHLGYFLLYVAYFPQLVAGPIERSTNLFHQLKEPIPFSYERTVDGLRLILWGMFKKVVVADRLGLYVDMAFNNVGMHTGPTHLLAAYFFCLQVYCDFSGYSDIATGTARIMGVDLMLNFNKIYWAKSVTEYWQRNHISLTTWFRDYLYIPLGGGRVGVFRKYLNVMIIFLVSGLWHGAAWTFVCWGLLNGFYLVYELATRDLRKRVTERLGLERWPRSKALVRIAMTFNLIAFGLMFFRSRSLTEGFTILGTITSLPWGPLNIGSLSNFVYAWFGVLALIGVEYFQGEEKRLEKRIAGLNLPWRWGWYVFCSLGILLVGVFDGGQFIYFQF